MLVGRLGRLRRPCRLLKGGRPEGGARAPCNNLVHVVCRLVHGFVPLFFSHCSASIAGDDPQVNGSLAIWFPSGAWGVISTLHDDSRPMTCIDLILDAAFDKVDPGIGRDLVDDDLPRNICNARDCC